MRRSLLLAPVVLLATACGGGAPDSADPAPTAADVDAATPDATAPSTATTPEDTPAAAAGVGTATVTVDGAAPVTFGFVDLDTTGGDDALVDITQERCDADLMGAGFVANGYLLAEDGSVALADDDTLAGTLVLSLPAEGTADLEPDVSLDLAADGLSAGLVEGTTGWTVDGTTATGDVTLVGDGVEHAVTFELTCPS